MFVKMKFLFLHFRFHLHFSLIEINQLEPLTPTKVHFFFFLHKSEAWQGYKSEVAYDT